MAGAGTAKTVGVAVDEPLPLGERPDLASRDVLQAVVDLIPLVVWSAVPHASVDLANQHAVEYVGLPAAEWDWPALIHPHDAGRYAVLQDEVVESGMPYEATFRLRRADGEFRWQHGQITLVRDDGGRTVRWLGTCTDIHEQRQVAETLQQMREEHAHCQTQLATNVREQGQREVTARHDQKLESLGRLSAGLAHEINTPIQFVGDNTRFLASAYQDLLGLIQIYRDCLNDAMGEVAWDARIARAQEAEREADIDYLAAEVPIAVAQSLEGVERVASLVRAMKSFSYKDSTERSYADLNEAIKTTLTVARNEVKYVADVALDLGELPDVLCHLGDLNQVFLNLVVNAADAMQERPERGEIRITTRHDNDHVTISFADNGCGVPEHLQQAIFDPFFTTKEVGKGTGQGLALARAVCEKHGGTIDLRSVPGQGAEFILRLPVAGRQVGSA